MKRNKLSIRIPKEEHEWLKKHSEITKGTDNYTSMNSLIIEAIQNYIQRKER